MVVEEDEEAEEAEEAEKAKDAEEDHHLHQTRFGHSKRYRIHCPTRY